MIRVPLHDYFGFTRFCWNIALIFFWTGTDLFLSSVKQIWLSKAFESSDSHKAKQLNAFGKCAFVLIYG